MNIRALDNIQRYFHRMGGFMVGDSILLTNAEHSTVPQFTDDGVAQFQAIIQ